MSGSNHQQKICSARNCKTLIDITDNHKTCAPCRARNAERQKESRMRKRNSTAIVQFRQPLVQPEAEPASPTSLQTYTSVKWAMDYEVSSL